MMEIIGLRKSFWSERVRGRDVGTGSSALRRRSAGGVGVDPAPKPTLVTHEKERSATGVKGPSHG